MERFYVLHPEVAGGLGGQSVIDRSSHPPIVRSLHYEFSGWLGDDLVETFPCFLVTTRLAAALRAAGISSFEIADATVTRSTEFDDLHPNLQLPDFVWLKPHGTPGKDPVALAPDASLVVSAPTLAVLRSFRIAQCEVAPWPPN